MTLAPKAPPEFGEVAFSLSVAPVSLQASPEAKKKLVEAIRTITKPLEYLLYGEVQVEVQWFIQERLRWETDTSPDVDNILKPLSDSLCGLDGLLIDDCQIQAITSSWIDWTRDDQKLDIRIRFSPDDYCPKAGLSFVRLKEALCYPVPGGMGGDILQRWLDFLENAVQAREKIATLTQSYYPGRLLLPRCFFHRSHIKEFPVHYLAELRKLDSTEQ